jgi:hypothetical protein
MAPAQSAGLEDFLPASQPDRHRNQKSSSVRYLKESMNYLYVTW